jgi:hypothetical protein|tara:strand:- start:187 stop:768 length:582 start_codon:yes stop_codon:yes gene_type:complete
MEPFQAFSLYQAIKLHFESDSYDAVKYNYKTSAKPQSFWKRKDKYFFAKVGKRFETAEQLKFYYISHFIKDNKWIGDMISNEGPYDDWIRINESLGYIFEQDLYKLSEEISSFDDLFKIDVHPKIVEKYMQDEISLETVVIINKLVGFMNKADKEITETIVWPDISRKIRKYTPFVMANPERMKKIILKVFTS